MENLEIEIDNLRRLFHNRDTFEFACGFYEGSLRQTLQCAEFDNLVANKGFVLKDDITFEEWQKSGFCFSFATRLECQDRQLTSLPAEIGELVNLKFLYCNDNKLTELPIDMCKLVNLKIIVCSNNQLTALPSETGNLVSLGYFDIEKNQLSTLPAEIGKLIELKTLRCASNLLTSLPTETGKLAKLEYLYCENNRIETHPDLSHLPVLDVYAK